MWLNSNCDKTQIVVNRIFFTINTIKWSFSSNILTPWHPMRCSLGSFLRFLQCFYMTHLYKKNLSFCIYKLLSNLTTTQCCVTSFCLAIICQRFLKVSTVGEDTLWVGHRSSLDGWGERGSISNIEQHNVARNHPAIWAFQGEVQINNHPGWHCSKFS